MMKTALLLAFACCSVSLTYAQEEQAIRQWQSRHPSTLLISTKNYAQLTPAQKEAIGTDYVLFDDQITLALLEGVSGKESVGESASGREADRDFVKQWAAQNPDLKFIPRSIFDAFSEDDRYLYENDPRCLVLIGETLTKADIDHYVAH